MLTGWMQALGGQADVGIRNLNQSLLLARSEGLVGTEVENQALLATVLLSRGDIPAADTLVRDALQNWEARGLTHFLASGALLSGPAAFLAARAGDEDEAASRLRQAQEAALTFGTVFPWLTTSSATRSLLLPMRPSGTGPKPATTSRRRWRRPRGLDTSPLLADLVAMARESVEQEFRLAALSRAERRVFDRLLTRATLREIADSLFVSPRDEQDPDGLHLSQVGRVVASRPPRTRIPFPGRLAVHRTDPGTRTKNES